MSDKLGPKAISTIKSVFLILFVDLMGFSIIFPLFPDLIDYYLETDRNNFLLSFIINLIGDIDSDFGRFKLIVLFGGIIGAIYSLLQYISSPFWGNLSDKIGRKTVLKITLMGTFFSYVVWIFSASFTVLVLSRVLSGLMSGNISVATACISDVTNEKNRSKGMAFVGIAFALGFILGPALGGIFSLVSFEVMPYMHKFSAVALVASLLSFINIVFIYFKFEETNKLDNNNSDKKIINPLERIIQLEGVSFNWKKDNQESIGLIAQDVEKVFPELVSTNKEGLKTVAYGNLIAPLIEALKVQESRIESQESRIESQESRIESQDNKIEQLIKEIEQLKNEQSY